MSARETGKKLPMGFILLDWYIGTAEAPVAVNNNYQATNPKQMPNL
jgi:hypothetical protein